jgi:hypothetical protein
MAESHTLRTLCLFPFHLVFYSYNLIKPYLMPDPQTISPTELTLEDFDYTFSDPFLRAAFAQKSFKFRYQRKDPYIRVKWGSIIVNDPFSRSVPPRKVSEYRLWDWFSERIDENFVVKVDIHRLAGLWLAVTPEWLESELTSQDKRVMVQTQVSGLLIYSSTTQAHRSSLPLAGQESFLGFESVRSFASFMQDFTDGTGKSIEKFDCDLAAGMNLHKNDWTALVAESVKSGAASSGTAIFTETPIWGSVVYSLRSGNQ